LHTLSAPRSDISVGARWQQEVGPIGPGLAAEHLLVVEGITEANLQVNKSLRAGIIAKLAETLGLEVGGNLQSKYQFRLEKAQLVRVNDINKLGPIQAGSSFVWEGLKLKDFSFADSIKSESKIKAEISKGIPKAKLDVKANLENSNMRSYQVNGADLFLAYRVISFGVGGIQYLGRHIFTRDFAPELTATLGNEYSIEFQPRLSNIGSQCKGETKVTAFNQLDETGNTVHKQWELWCSGTDQESRSFELNTVFVSEGIAIDQLALENVRLEKDNAANSQYRVLGKVEVQRRTLTIQTLAEPKAQGW
jgi:hypothetical protein